MSKSALGFADGTNAPPGPTCDLGRGPGGQAGGKSRNMRVNLAESPAGPRWGAGPDPMESPSSPPTSCRPASVLREDFELRPDGAPRRPKTGPVPSTGGGRERAFLNEQAAWPRSAGCRWRARVSEALDRSGAGPGSNVVLRVLLLFVRRAGIAEKRVGWSGPARAVVASKIPGLRAFSGITRTRHGFRSAIPGAEAGLSSPACRAGCAEMTAW